MADLFLVSAVGQFQSPPKQGSVCGT